MSKPILADLPPRYQEQVRAQLQRTPHPRTVAIEQAEPKLSLRQNRSGMNKTEARFADWLRSKNPTAHIHREVSLPLANGVRYKVDFLCARPGEYPNKDTSCTVTGYEVKGFMRDDAAVKLKVAAQAYPWITFFLVKATRDPAHPWSFEQVFP